MQFLLHEADPVAAPQLMVLAMQMKMDITIYPQGVIFHGYVPIRGRITHLQTEDGSGYNWIVSFGNEKYFINTRRSPCPKL
jgi:hypothetical protein